MTIKVLGLLHAGVRIPANDEKLAKAQKIYGELLGLQVDDNRGVIKGIPGFWVKIGTGEQPQQIHIMGADGQSPAARSDVQDPTRPHVALAVEDIAAAKAALTAHNIDYWVYESLVGAGSMQLFFEDGCGNMIELQEQKA